jgi:L-cysteine S-thiosulfotransferase
MKSSWRSFLRGKRIWIAVSGAALLGACAAVGTQQLATSKTWESRAIPESQGHIREVDGKRQQIRYPFGGFGTVDFSKWPTFAYGSHSYPPPQKAVMPTGIKGDPKKGEELVKNRSLGPCTACHLIPDPSVWPMGNVGPDLRAIGDRGLPDSFLYQLVYDPRVIYGPDSPMPPFGASGIFSPDQIVHVVAYLQSLRADWTMKPPVTGDKQWNPFTRDVVRPEYGDQLDPTANPALLLTDANAVQAWSKPGPKGQSCASCHGKIEAADDQRPLGVIKSMVGVGVSYPKWFDRYRRMMSVEDFLAVHGPETTGQQFPTQGQDNITMAILVKMQSNGMPYQLNLKDPNVQAAVKRGQELFHRPVGQRAHACADCHTERGGANKFLGGRFLANVDKEPMINHPYYRTAQARLWDIRIRMQWCMTPLRTNILPGDSPEYADLETYILSKQTQRGDKLVVPRISH